MTAVHKNGIKKKGSALWSGNETEAVITNTTMPSTRKQRHQDKTMEQKQQQCQQKERNNLHKKRHHNNKSGGSRTKKHWLQDKNNGIRGVKWWPQHKPEGIKTNQYNGKTRARDWRRLYHHKGAAKKQTQSPVTSANSNPTVNQPRPYATESIRTVTPQVTRYLPNRNTMITLQ